MKSNKIIFFGTPQFALTCLEYLINKNFNIVAVVTAPDKLAGRGLKLHASPIKEFAIKQNIKVLQPINLKSVDFLNELKNFQADLQIVVAFRMLPESVWNMPPLGTINLHASLLPNYRGAAPIHWAIINGETMTGVTIFKLNKNIDTGDIYFRQEVPIEERDTVEILYNKLSNIGANLLAETVNKIFEFNLEPTPQKDFIINENLPVAPKLQTFHSVINWQKPVKEVYNLIRGMNNFPGAYTFIQTKIVKIFDVNKVEEKPDIPPGNFKLIDNKKLYFACNDGYIEVLSLQLEGKKKMNIEAFLNGMINLLKN